jgi:hypothetical protein
MTKITMSYGDKMDEAYQAFPYMVIISELEDGFPGDVIDVKCYSQEERAREVAEQYVNLNKHVDVAYLIGRSTLEED